MRLFYLVLSACLVFFVASAQEIKILYTAALIDEQYEMRKSEYLYSLEILHQKGYRPYIVEACKQASFFDECSFPVFYAMTNNKRLKNKGVNEARLLVEGLKYYQFFDEDLVLKLTGRYFFTDFSFLEYISNHLDMDGFIRYGNVQRNSFFTGCFALKAKFLRQFLEELDLDKMEKESINIEDELWRFLSRNPNIKLCLVDSLGLTANIFGTGKCQLTHW